MKQRYYIGCDLGGTNIKAGVVDMQVERVLATESTPTLSHEGPEAVLKRISKISQSVVNKAGLNWAEIGGMGMSTPGRLDMEKGETLFLPNLISNWVHIPVTRILQEQMGKPVYLLNDARAITYGEWAYGAGKGADCMLCLAIGTGIGGGVVMNNRLVLTQGGSAGELGHMTIDVNGPLCGCGNYGCVESFASGPAIAAMGVKAVVQGQSTKIGELAGYDLNKITPFLIARAAESGDRVAKQIFETAGACIGVAVMNAALVVGPQRVVITGGVAAAGDLLLDPIRREVKSRMVVMDPKGIEILQGTLGDEAGIIGTAIWAAKRGGLD